MAKRLKQKENTKKARRSLRIQKNDKKEANSKISPAVESEKRVKTSKKKVVDSIPFRSPVREIRLSFQNISASPLNASNVDCYDFELEDEDCRKRLSLSKTTSKRTKPLKKKRKTSPVSLVKDHSIGSKQRIRQTSLKRKFISKSENLSLRKRPKQGDMMVMSGSKISPVSTDCLRSIKSVMKNARSLADSGVPVSPLHDISNIDPVIIVVRKTSTPSLTKTGQNGLKNELVTSALKKKEKRKPKSKEHSVSVRKSSLRSASRMLSQATKEISNISSVRSANSNHNSLDHVESPMLSPVQKVTGEECAGYGSFISSQSELFDSTDYTSSTTNYRESDELKCERFNVLDISKTYSSLGFGFFDRSIKKKKRIKRLKKASRKSISHYDVLATQINQEFDDLEGFQLSID